MRRLLLLAALAASASAQPGLPVDSARAVLDRLRASDLVADSTAGELAACAEAGAPVTPAVLVGAVRDHVCVEEGMPGCGTPFAGMVGMVKVDSLAPPFPPVSWPDTLAAVGLLTDRERVSLVDEVEAVFADVSLRNIPPFALQQLTIMEAVLWARERMAPEALAARADDWVAAGLMSPRGRQGMLRAVEAGEIRVLQDALLFIDAAVWTGVELPSRDGGEPLGRAEVDRLLMDATDLLRRRGVLDVQVSDVALDARDGAWLGPGASSPGARTGRSSVLSARVDGEAFRQRAYAWNRWEAAADLINQVLRERGRRERLFGFIVPRPSTTSGRLVLLVLTPEQLLAVQGHGRGDEVSPFSMGLLEMAQRFEKGTPCYPIAWRYVMGQFDIDGPELRGPELQDDEAALTHDAIGQTVDRLDAVGLLDALTPEQRAAYRDALQSRYLRSAEPLIEGLPGLVYRFDWERAYGDRPYAELLDDFAALSRGGFDPTDVVDTFSNEADSVDVAFTERGVRYEGTFAVRDEWLDSGILDLVAAATAGREARFYQLGRFTDDGVAYLTPAQAAVLRDLGLLTAAGGPVGGGE